VGPEGILEGLSQGTNGERDVFHTEQHGELAQSQKIYSPVGRSWFPFKTALDKTSFLSVSSSYKVRVKRNPLPLSTEYISSAALQRILPNGLRRKLGGG
jgi:hypothetical protein